MTLVEASFYPTSSYYPRSIAASASSSEIAPFGTASRIFWTFCAVSLCWVFFRPDLDGALAMLNKMVFIDTAGKPLPLHNRSLWYTVAFVLVCHVLVEYRLWQRLWDRLPAPAMGFSYAVCLTAALLLAPEMAQTFIYFTF